MLRATSRVARRATMALVVTCATACLSDEMTGRSGTTGTYTLHSVNGERLPYTVSSGPTTTEILDDAISLYVGETYAQTGRRRTTVNAQTTVTETGETGTYAYFGKSLSFRTSDGRSTKLAVVDGSRMTFVEDGLTLVYQK